MKGVRKSVSSSKAWLGCGMLRGVYLRIVMSMKLENKFKFFYLGLILNALILPQKSVATSEFFLKKNRK